MRCRKGMTLIEIVVVIITIGVALTFALPNFTAPSEHAKAVTVQNNLLAIYSAQQNFYNNQSPNAYCLAACGSIAAIDTALSLDIQDDGTYLYSCAGVICTAIRNDGSGKGLTLTLNAPVVTGGGNPSCNLTGWCP